MNWNLTPLYLGFEASDFKADCEKYIAMLGELEAWGASLISEKQAEDQLEAQAALKKNLEIYINLSSAIKLLGGRLMSFASLTTATNTRDSIAQGHLEQLRSLSNRGTAPQVAFKHYLKSQPTQMLLETIEQTEVLKAHKFHLQELLNQTAHLQSEGVEVVLAKLKETGSDAWSTMQGQLTSGLIVTLDIEGETKTLPLQSARNLAFNADGKIRKDGYLAELDAYSKIELASAGALNAIKGEVITETALRGFESVLDRTLFDARMQKTTLDAMLEAVKEFLPVIRNYQKTKARVLGHQNGLPFYEIHAPLSKETQAYSFDDAKKIVTESFYGFSKAHGEFAEEAFAGNWVDVAPKQGKRGGAFCSGIPAIKESRVLMNFTGSLNNVITLAHELGHGYHGRQIFKQTPLNGSYSMPVAETASIFCETILKQALLKNLRNSDASDDLMIGVLETSIQGYAQTIMDIYSRYLFETELFDRRKEGSLSVDELNQLMLSAQKQAYGDALDPEYLHPYMWVNKVHYYYAERNFYNFPYTFGLLFAKGLFAYYQKTGEAFLPQYDQLLGMTGQLSVEGVAKLVGIDITQKAFWEGGLAVVKGEIDQLEALLNKV